MEKHQTYFNLFDALKETGCPICFLSKKIVHKSMDDFLYENVNDPKLRQEIKAAQGFCHRHAWQLQKFGDGFGQAIVYSDLMDTVLKRLKMIDEAVSLKEISKTMTCPKEAKTVCVFCRRQEDAEERYISVFWESFDDAEFSFHYKNSLGLCLPHLALVLKKCRSVKLSKELMAIEVPKFSVLGGELKEFIRKHDYRYSKEKFGKEGDSWIRAIEKIMGKEGIF
jgi:hypothetical protein